MVSNLRTSVRSRPSPPRGGYFVIHRRRSRRPHDVVTVGVVQPREPRRARRFFFFFSRRLSCRLLTHRRNPVGASKLAQNWSCTSRTTRKEPSASVASSIKFAHPIGWHSEHHSCGRRLHRDVRPRPRVVEAPERVERVGEPHESRVAKPGAASFQRVADLRLGGERGDRDGVFLRATFAVLRRSLPRPRDGCLAANPRRTAFPAPCRSSPKRTGARRAPRSRRPRRASRRGTRSGPADTYPARVRSRRCPGSGS